MKRKDAIVRIAAAGFGVGASSALIVAASNRPMRSGAPAAQRGKPLSPPKSGPVKVALVIGPDLVAIDIFGPYAAFRAASLAHDTTSSPLFEFYMLAKTTDSIDVDGLQLRPHYSFDDAPQPHVVVVPNQLGSDETVAYVKRAASNADVTMAVCTGAFIVGQAGLFDGLRATTHHLAYDAFARSFPRVTLLRGPKYVEEPNVSSSGGETSGIDLALRVVERYYGADVAKNAAYMMEYRRSDRPQQLNDV